MLVFNSVNKNVPISFEENDDVQLCSRCSTPNNMYGRYSSLGDDISRREAQKCEVEINRTLHALYKQSKEIVYPYVARGNNQEGLR